MHSDDGYGMVSELGYFFAEFGNPVKPNRIYLNFNKTNKVFTLTTEFYDIEKNNELPMPSAVLTQQMHELLTEYDPSFHPSFPYIYPHIIITQPKGEIDNSKRTSFIDEFFQRPF